MSIVQNGSSSMDFGLKRFITEFRTRQNKNETRFQLIYPVICLVASPWSSSVGKQSYGCMYVTVADCVYVGRKWQKWNICTLLIYSFVIFLNALNFLANFICVILDEFGDVAGVCVCVCGSRELHPCIIYQFVSVAITCSPWWHSIWILPPMEHTLWTCTCHSNHRTNDYSFLVCRLFASVGFFLSLFSSL